MHQKRPSWKSMPLLLFLANRTPSSNRVGKKEKGKQPWQASMSRADGRGVLPRRPAQRGRTLPLLSNFHPSSSPKSSARRLEVLAVVGGDGDGDGRGGLGSGAGHGGDAPAAAGRGVALGTVAGAGVGRDRLGGGSGVAGDVALELVRLLRVNGDGDGLGAVGETAC